MLGSKPGDWNHVPRAALRLSHGEIKPMGYLTQVERRPLFWRLFNARRDDRSSKGSQA